MQLSFDPIATVIRSLRGSCFCVRERREREKALQFMYGRNEKGTAGISELIECLSIPDRAANGREKRGRHASNRQKKRSLVSEQED